MKSVFDMVNERKDLKEKIHEYEKAVHRLIGIDRRIIEINAFKKEEFDTKKDTLEVSFHGSVEIDREKITELQKLFGIIDYKICIYDECSGSKIEFYPTKGGI